jgi:hypothetical protein
MLGLSEQTVINFTRARASRGVTTALTDIAIAIAGGASVTSTNVFFNTRLKRIKVFRSGRRGRRQALLLRKPELLNDTPGELLHQFVEEQVDGVA